MSDKVSANSSPAFTKLSSRSWMAIGVFAAGVLLAESNMLSARNFVRWDVSAGQNYTLSTATQKLLAEVKSPAQFTLLLGTGAPQRLELRYLLDAYRAANKNIQIRNIDPDRQPVEFMGITQSLSAFQGDAGSLPSAPAVLLEKGEQKWVIYEHQLSQGQDEGQSRSLAEQRLSEALAHVLQNKSSRICFVTGHGEASLDDASPEGLLRLRALLSRSHVQAERIPLDVPDPEAALAACDALAVVGPTRVFPASHQKALIARFQAGAALLMFLDPLVDKDARVQKNGLEEAAKLAGVSFEPAFILETDPRYRIPSGMGEAFFASPDVHAITDGLSTEQARLDARVMMIAAMPLQLLAAASAQRLLQTSPDAFAISDLSKPQDSEEDELRAPFALAYAQEHSSRGRAVVVASSNILQNRAFEDPTQFGNQLFAENAFAWALEQSALVSVPERPQMAAGLSLSEEALSSLLRYVMLYLPLSAMLLGSWVLFFRHHKEDRSRAKNKGQPS